MGIDSPSTMWVLWIELGSSGLVVSSWTVLVHTSFKICLWGKKLDLEGSREEEGRKGIFKPS